MLKLKKIAITGGIASGKSEAGKIFQELGAHVVDADKIVHQLLTPDTDLGKQIVELLGQSIVVEGEIDRARVAKKVFLNPRLLRSLEKLLHPIVYEEIESEYHRINQSEQKPPLFVAQIPLLFEKGWEKNFDHSIAVIADDETCWERYRRSTGHEREDFNRRLARQLRQSEKADKAEFVIQNNGSIEELHSKVLELFNTLTVPREGEI